MDIILMLIPAALMVSGVFIIVFYWSVKSEQYEDFEGEAHRILMEDEEPYATNQSKTDKEITDDNTDDANRKSN